MARSKESLNNSVLKSPQPGIALESMNKNTMNGKTKTRPGSKRPVPVGSEESESDVETGMPDDLIASLKGSHKKPKLASDRSLNLEKEEDESDEEEDDEDDDENDDEEDDDDDDDDDEDDEDDDDEEEEEDGESDEDKTTQVALKAKGVSPKRALQKPASQPKSEKITATVPTASPKKAITETKLQSSVQSNTASGSVIIMNAPENLDSLKEFISKISTVTNIQKMNPAPILVTVANLTSLKNRLKSGKLMFQGKQLEVIPMDRSGEDRPTANLFVGGIPKSISIEQLKGHLPNGCQPVSFKLLDRNPSINSAVMTFSSPDVAVKACEVFRSLKLGDQNLRVSFSTQTAQTSPDSSPKIMVLNYKGNPGRLRKVFPTCIDVQYDQKKRKAYLKFPSLEVRQAAVSEPKFVDGRKLSLALLGGPEHKTALIIGLPADVKDSQIKELFGGVVSISRETRSPQEKQTAITVEFKTAADCYKAISSNATLNGQRVVIFYKAIFVDEVPKKKVDSVASVRQGEPPAKKAKVTGETNDEDKLKVKASKSLKAKQISGEKDEDEEEEEEEDDEEEADESDEDNEEDDSEEEEDDDDDDDDDEEEEEEDDDDEEESDGSAPLAPPNDQKNKKPQNNTHDKKQFGDVQAMNNRPGGQGNFKGNQKFGGNFKHNSPRGRGGQSFRGHSGQSPRGRGGQPFRGRGGNRGGWSKRGGHNKNK